MNLPKRNSPPPPPKTSHWLSRLIEKFLFSVVSYAILAFLSFSFFTGRFPPKKEDLSRAAVLLKKMFVDANEAKVQTQALQKESDAGQAPSLEQIAEFQRLSLRRTEVAMELLTIFKKLNLNTEPNVVVEEKLKSISNQLTEVEKGLGEITAHLQAATQTQ